MISFFLGWLLGSVLASALFVGWGLLMERRTSHLIKQWDIPETGSAHLDRVCDTCGNTESFR